jgi:hypothetical protein
MEKQDYRITIYPDEQLRKYLEELAGEEERSLNNLVLMILKKHFKYKNNLMKKEVKNGKAK